jgi:fumarate hydratase class II
MSTRIERDSMREVRVPDEALVDHPDLQSGSIVMPGKVNPVIPERLPAVASRKL